jgi:hypothetical protein
VSSAVVVLDPGRFTSLDCACLLATLFARRPSLRPPHALPTPANQTAPFERPVSPIALRLREINAEISFICTLSFTGSLVNLLGLLLSTSTCLTAQTRSSVGRCAVNLVNWLNSLPACCATDLLCNLLNRQVSHAPLLIFNMLVMYCYSFQYPTYSPPRTHIPRPPRANLPLTFLSFIAFRCPVDCLLLRSLIILWEAFAVLLAISLLD